MQAFYGKRRKDEDDDGGFISTLGQDNGAASQKSFFNNPEAKFKMNIMP